MSIIYKGMTREEIIKTLQAAQASESQELDKYFGFLKLEESPIEIQNRLRNEWK